MDRRAAVTRVAGPVLVAALAAGAMVLALGDDPAPPPGAGVASPDPAPTVTASDPRPHATDDVGDLTTVALCLPQRGNVGRSDVVAALAADATGPASVRVDRLRDPAPHDPTTVQPGAAVALPVEPATAAVRVGVGDPATGVPAVHQVSTFPRGPAGTIAGPCPTTRVGDVVFPGLTTADGTITTIALGNPTDAEVVVSIELLTPEGAELPGYSQVVPIAAGGSTVFFVTDVAPDRPDLGVHVRAREGGSFVASAMEARVARGGGIEGRTWITAPAPPARSWVLPRVLTAGDPTAGLGDAAGSTSADAWLWVANPGDTTAAVEVELLTPHGRRPLDAPVDPVPPGSVRRVDLAGVAGDVAGDVGALVTADADVVVGAGEVVRGGGDRGGIVAATGVTEAETAWVASGPAAADRVQVVTVTNPGDESAVVDVAVVADGADATPVEQGLTVPAGATATTTLPDTGDATTVTVVVTASEGAVTTQLRSAVSGTGSMDVVAVQAAPLRG